MARRGGSIKMDELVTYSNQVEDYSSGDLVITNTTAGKFWAKIGDVKGSTGDKNPLIDKHRDNDQIMLMCREAEVNDIDLGTEITLSRDPNTVYTVNDKYGGSNYKFYTTIIAYSTSN